jgi:hypothetical protein
MTSWSESEIKRLEKELSFYENTEILDPCTGVLRSKIIKLLLNYHKGIFQLST